MSTRWGASLQSCLAGTEPSGSVPSVCVLVHTLDIESVLWGSPIITFSFSFFQYCIHVYVLWIYTDAIFSSSVCPGQHFHPQYLSADVMHNVPTFILKTFSKSDCISASAILGFNPLGWFQRLLPWKVCGVTNTLCKQQVNVIRNDWKKHIARKTCKLKTQTAPAHWQPDGQRSHQITQQPTTTLPQTDKRILFSLSLPQTATCYIEVSHHP